MNESSVMSRVTCYSLLFLLITGATVNLRVISVICTFSKRRRNKARNVLLAHVSLVSLLETGILLLVEGSKLHWEFHWNDHPAFKRALVFLWDTLQTVFPINLGLVEYLCIKSVAGENVTLDISGMIAVSWMVSLLVSTPPWVLVENLDTDLVDKWSVGIYEMVRFSLSFGTAVGYYGYALARMQVKLNELEAMGPAPVMSSYLRSCSPYRCPWTATQLRGLCLHTVLLMCTWLHAGISLHLKWIWEDGQSETWLFTDHKNLLDFLSWKNGLAFGAMVFSWAYLTATSTIFLCLFENRLTWKTLVFSCFFSNRLESPENEEQMEQISSDNIELETLGEDSSSQDVGHGYLADDENGGSAG